LLVRQYDTVGQLIRALQKTYVIAAKTQSDVEMMWVGLSQIRALLPVQMSQEEEALMRTRLWYARKLLSNSRNNKRFEIGKWSTTAPSSSTQI
jgi:hypothetical protein